MKGPDLTVGVNGASMVSSSENGKLVLIGGQASSGMRTEMLEFRCESGICSWTELDEALLVGRAYGFAVAVPDNV